MGGPCPATPPSTDRTGEVLIALGKISRQPLIVRTFDVLSSGKHVLVGQSYPPVASTDILHAAVNSM